MEASQRKRTAEEEALADLRLVIADLVEELPGLRARRMTAAATRLSNRIDDLRRIERTLSQAAQAGRDAATLSVPAGGRWEHDWEDESDQDGSRLRCKKCGVIIALEADAAHYLKTGVTRWVEIEPGYAVDGDTIPAECYGAPVPSGASDSDPEVRYGAAVGDVYAESPLARYQPCGCQICVCEGEERCLGCGAKYCGTHPLGEIPNPVYLQPWIPLSDLPARIEAAFPDVEAVARSIAAWYDLSLDEGRKALAGLDAQAEHVRGNVLQVLLARLTEGEAHDD